MTDHLISECAPESSAPSAPPAWREERERQGGRPRRQGAGAGPHSGERRSGPQAPAALHMGIEGVLKQLVVSMGPWDSTLESSSQGRRESGGRGSFHDIQAAKPSFEGRA